METPSLEVPKLKVMLNPPMSFGVILPFFLLLEPEHLRTTDLRLAPIDFPYSTKHSLNVPGSRSYLVLALSVSDS